MMRDPDMARESTSGNAIATEYIATNPKNSTNSI